MKRPIQLITSSVLTLIFFTGCATTPYEAQESTTTRLGDSAVRYGTTAVVGAGAGFAVAEATKSPALGVGAGVLASILTLGLFKFGDHRADNAYKIGLESGTKTARAEIVKERWTREAVYGLPPEGSSKTASNYRRVWVPAREVNGVKYLAGYQTVEVYH